MRSMIPIPLYESRYIISPNGEVYSLLTKRWLRKLPDKNGYWKVNLYSGGRGTIKTYRVCRLVASSYLYPDINRPYVNHIDGNKQNDNYQNLEWVSAKENSHHAWLLGLCKTYDRTQPYNREGIILSNKRRTKKGQICGQ